jgi:hypothetical protein
MHLKVNCPAMTIGSGLRRTANGPMVAGLTFDDCNSVVFPAVVVQAAYARSIHWPLKWCVDACAAEGEHSGYYLQIRLPPQAWNVELLLGYVEADAMLASATVNLPDGRIYHGDIQFPSWRQNLYSGIAESVVAEGELNEPLGSIH